MDSLAQIVKDTLSWYVGGSFHHRMYGVADEENQVYAVLIVDFPVHKRPPRIVVMARIVNDKVVIEEDRTDRPLVDALIRKGVPAENIVCPDEGDLLPDADQAALPTAQP